MRKLVPVVFLMLAVSASAQTVDQPTRVTFFMSNLAMGWSEGGGEFFDAGVGLALERRISEHFSAELAVATEEHHVQTGFFNTTDYDLRTYPVDAVVRYSFLDADAAWRPYVGAGARYVAAPDEPPGLDYDNQLAPEITAGVEFNHRNSWSFVAGVRQLIQDQSPDFDDWFKVSVGIGWRF